MHTITEYTSFVVRLLSTGDLEHSFFSEKITNYKPLQENTPLLDPYKTQSVKSHTFQYNIYRYKSPKCFGYFVCSFCCPGWAASCVVRSTVARRTAVTCCSSCPAWRRSSPARSCASSGYAYGWIFSLFISVLNSKYSALFSSSPFFSELIFSMRVKSKQSVDGAALVQSKLNIYLQYRTHFNLMNLFIIIDKP